MQVLPINAFNCWSQLQKYLMLHKISEYEILGNLNFMNSDDEYDFTGLHCIHGSLNVYHANIKTLANIKKITGSLTLPFSTLESIDSLEYVGEDLYLGHTNIKTLGTIKYIGGHINAMDSNLYSLGNLEFLGGNIYIDSKSKLTDYDVSRFTNKIKFL